MSAGTASPASPKWRTSCQRDFLTAPGMPCFPGMLPRSALLLTAFLPPMCNAANHPSGRNCGFGGDTGGAWQRVELRGELRAARPSVGAGTTAAPSRATSIRMCALPVCGLPRVLLPKPVQWARLLRRARLALAETFLHGQSTGAPSGLLAHRSPQGRPRNRRGAKKAGIRCFRWASATVSNAPGSVEIVSNLTYWADIVLAVPM